MGFGALWDGSLSPFDKKNKTSDENAVHFAPKGESHGASILKALYRGPAWLGQQEINAYHGVGGWLSSDGDTPASTSTGGHKPPAQPKPLQHLDFTQTPAAQSSTKDAKSALSSLLGMIQGQADPAKAARVSLEQTLADVNEQFNRQERKLNERYSNLNTPTATETHKWQMQHADLLAERHAAVASINLSFNQGAAHNAADVKDARAQSGKDAAAVAGIYSAAAAGAAADTKASAGLTDGGVTGGDGSDTASYLRAEQASQATLAHELGDNVASELKALGTGLSEQRLAQTGAAARASAWAMAQARQAWADKVDARQQHDRDALYTALDALNNARTSAMLDTKGKEADYAFQSATSRNAQRTDLMGTAMADRLKEVGNAASGAPAGGFLATLRGTVAEEKLAKGMSNNKPIKASWQGDDGVTHTKEFSPVELASQAQELLGGITATDPGQARLQYQQALMDMGPDLYAAMVKAGYGPSLVLMTQASKAQWK